MGDVKARRVLVLCGPTGVGKTEVAVELARRHGLELVNADSRQVYSWMDIGTAKPSRELRREVAFHMIDMVEPDKPYSAADYARDAGAVMRRLGNEGRKFIMVGGAGLYLRAVFEPFFASPKPDPALRRRLEGLPAGQLHERLKTIDPDRAAQLHPNDKQRVMRALEIREQTGRTFTELVSEAAARVEWEPAYAGLTVERDLLHRRIDARFDAMMAAGLLDEVRGLGEAGFGRSTYVANAYGYAELLAHLDGEVGLADAVTQAKARSRAYARKQLTWFRALAGIRWFESTTPEETASRVEPLLREVLAY